jgi:cytoskeletal protein CcmA (bactofilin family)
LAGEFPEIQILGGTGEVELDRERPFAPRNPFVVHKVLTARGEYDGTTVEIEIKTKRREFSRYSYFTVSEPTIYFTTGDTLNGPVHTNDEFHIDGDPVFNGKVTSPNDWVASDGNQNNHNPQFNGGKNFNAEEIDLPIEVPNLDEAANDNGLRFNSSIKAQFNASDSSVTIQTGNKSGGGWSYSCWCYQPPSYNWSSPTKYSLNSDVANGVISASGDVKVQGEVNGDLTLHSESEVEIMGDLKYDKDPRTSGSSDDFLGIVSEGNVVVDKDAHEATGTKDVEIHASIMALGDSFEVEDYNDGEGRGQLKLLGGLIQQQRGPVGLTSGSGYKKYYSYDERFLGRAPRGFPPSDVYEFISWKTKY